MKKTVGRLSGARFLCEFLGQLYKVMFFYFLFLHSALLDWIMLILVWFERPLHSISARWLPPLRINKVKVKVHKLADLKFSLNGETDDVTSGSRADQWN